jgi:hypothetical protein
MVADPQTTIVSASALSGAACVSGSVHFNPPLSTPLYPARALPPPTDGSTGAVLLPAQGFAKASELHLRSLGKPHFAFALPAATLSYGGGPYYNAYVFFALERLPATISSEDEVHWLLSFHEASGQNRELIAIGVTPSGRLAGATRDSGILLSAKYTVPVDGLFHQAQLELEPTLGVRTLYLDGRCVVSAVGVQGTEEAVAEPGTPVRVSLFNGRDGLSVLNAAISRAGIGLGSFVGPEDPAPDDLAVNWPMDEGAGPNLACSTDVPSSVALAFGPVTLSATWFDGSPISACPDEPAAALTSAYTWAFKPAWTTRPPYSPEYRKVVLP